MVESISAKGVTANDLRVAPVIRAPTPAPAQAVASPASPALAGIARDMAASPPVDVDRVAQIKAAIASGTYPILPETIADRLIALKLDWTPDDKA